MIYDSKLINILIQCNDILDEHSIKPSDELMKLYAQKFTEKGDAKTKLNVVVARQHLNWLGKWINSKGLTVPLMEPQTLCYYLAYAYISYNQMGDSE